MPGSLFARERGELAELRPSEAGLEANVLRYLARWIERKRGKPEGWATITVPTQPHEKYLALDALARLDPGRYVALQFKRPDPKHGVIAFTVQEEQLCTLAKCPRGSAFYVLPAVASNREMWRIRTGLLDRTRLVDAQNLLPFCRGGPRPQKGGGGRKKEMNVWIDRCGADTALVRVRGRDVGRVRALPTGHLCSQRAAAGFVVTAGRRIKTKDGSGRSYDATRAESEERSMRGHEDEMHDASGRTGRVGAEGPDGGGEGENMYLVRIDGES